jgi:adenine-specific DNA-methyltransferase
LNFNYLDVKTLGQVFTPDIIIDFMINLIKYGENILEPSAGDGAFVNKLKEKGYKNITAIEIDDRFCKKNHFLCMDFFEFSIKNKFDTIIGNPPYVKYNQIISKTENIIINNKEIDFKKIFDNRTNLYQNFIYKAILHLKDMGELIFITPREFLKATSSIKLNKFIYNLGTITDFIDLGDVKLFNKALPNVIIFRFEKNNFSRKTKVYNTLNNNDYIIKNFIEYNGHLFFLRENYDIKFNDIFFIKVGGVSGADKYFEHPEGIEFVCSYTAKTGKTKRLIYNIYHPYLEQYKEKLINRKIKKFNENNWWEWGRKYYKTDKPRIYVNCKTRNKKPFFIHECKAYDGSVLAIFPKKKVTKQVLQQMINLLNEVNWEELGFYSNGRFLFSQRSLENSLLPNKFKKFL